MSNLDVLRMMEMKSNESVIYAYLGWAPCSGEIQDYEKCKKSGGIYKKNPKQCYSKARTLLGCYSSKGSKIPPICINPYNNIRECLFQGDSQLMHCKEQFHQLQYCVKEPEQYVQFLKASTDYQKRPKIYDFHLNQPKFDGN